MDRRQELNQILTTILGEGNVYFQPPSSIQLKYPAIIYSLDNVWSKHANDAPYMKRDRYLITVIDRNADSKIPDKIGKLPRSAFSTAFVKDNLHHIAYTLYF